MNHFINSAVTVSQGDIFFFLNSFTTDDVKPYAAELLVNLFAAMNREQSSENEYIMKGRTRRMCFASLRPPTIPFCAFLIVIIIVFDIWSCFSYSDTSCLLSRSWFCDRAVPEYVLNVWLAYTSTIPGSALNMSPRHHI